MRALRAAGASVESLAAVGGGIPDLLVGVRGATYLIEVKNPLQNASHKKLTPAQVEWHGLWRGQVAIVETPEEALRVIGASK